jgi:molybdopterin converting factor small subunit
MRLNVRLFAGLRERAGRELIELEVPDGTDVEGAKRLLEQAHPELGPLGPVRGVLGTRYVPDGTLLEGGAELALLPPVSGGKPGGAQT